MGHAVASPPEGDLSER